jgi:hypothetical protein
MEYGSSENGGCRADDQTLCPQKCTDDGQTANKCSPNPPTPFFRSIAIFLFYPRVQKYLRTL